MEEKRVFYYCQNCMMIPERKAVYEEPGLCPYKDCRKKLLETSDSQRELKQDLANHFLAFLESLDSMPRLYE